MEQEPYLKKQCEHQGLALKKIYTAPLLLVLNYQIEQNLGDGADGGAVLNNATIS